MSTEERDRGPSGDQPPRSRLEDEVLEILVRSEQPTSLADHVRRRTARRSGGPPPRAGRPFPGVGSVGPGTLLIASVGAAVLAAVARPESPLLAFLLGLGSAILFGAIWVRRFGGPGGPEVQRWRGRDLDLGPGGAAWVESLRDRFKRPPRF